MLKLSYRFQTLHNDSYTSKVQLEKPSKSIIVTKLINLYSDYVRISLDTLQVFIFGCSSFQSFAVILVYTLNT